MHNLTIETKRIVKCDFSADQWGLLTLSFPRDEIEKVATNLNNNIEEWVNNNFSKEATRTGMYNLMAELSKYGAYDSEVRDFLDMVIEEIYNK